MTAVMLFVVKFTDCNVGGPVERGYTSLRSREPFKLLRSRFLHEIYIMWSAKVSLDSEDLVQCMAEVHPKISADWTHLGMTSTGEFIQNQQNFFFGVKP